MQQQQQQIERQTALEAEQNRIELSRVHPSPHPAGLVTKRMLHDDGVLLLLLLLRPPRSAPSTWFTAHINTLS